MKRLIKNTVCFLILVPVIAVISCQKHSCDNVPGGIRYKIVDQNNINLLRLDRRQDIKVYKTDGGDTTHIDFDVDLAQDSTVYLYVRAVPFNKGMTYYLHIKNLPVDTLFVSTAETYHKNCSSLEFNQVLCNGQPCPLDKSTIPFLRVIRKTIKP